MVTQATLLAWHRKLFAKKYNGSATVHRVPPTDSNGNYCACSSFRQRKPKLGISADPRIHPRDFSSLSTKSESETAPSAFSFTKSLTACATC